MVSWKYLEDRTKDGCENEGVSLESSTESFFLRGCQVDHVNMERGREVSTENVMGEER